MDCTIVVVVSLSTGPEVWSSCLLLWVCYWYGTSVCDSDLPFHWIPGTYLSSSRVSRPLLQVELFAVYHKDFLLYARQLPHLGLKFTQLSGLFLSGGSLILFGYCNVKHTGLCHDDVTQARVTPNSLPKKDHYYTLTHKHLHTRTHQVCGYDGNSWIVPGLQLRTEDSVRCWDCNVQHSLIHPANSVLCHQEGINCCKCSTRLSLVLRLLVGGAKKSLVSSVSACA